MKVKCINIFLKTGLFCLFIISYSTVFSEEIESNVTVRILHDNTMIYENNDMKVNANIIDKQKIKKNKNFPKTNESVDISITLIGSSIFAISLYGVYLNNQRNGENKNEKN